MANTQQVTGLDELARALRELPKEIASKSGGPLKRSLLRTSKIFREAAKRNVPVDEGRLKGAIITKRDPRPQQNRGAVERYFISVRKGRKRSDPKGAYYGFMVERGHHDRAGNWVPGVFFMTRAYEENKRGALEFFKDDLAKGLRLAVKRARKKGYKV